MSMLAKLSKRPLATVYWLEAPGIIVMTVLIGFVIGLILRNKGMAGEDVGQIKVLLVFVGNLVAGGYIWLVSSNTSRLLYTWLARGSVLMVVGVWFALSLREYS
ncbi:MAG: hypothetical protein ABW076_11735 [Candidatus Thiodiazotropha sp.]